MGLYPIEERGTILHYNHFFFPNSFDLQFFHSGEPALILTGCTFYVIYSLPYFKILVKVVNYFPSAPETLIMNVPVLKLIL